MSLADIIRQHPDATARQIEERFGIKQQRVFSVRWADAHVEKERRRLERLRRQQGMLPPAERRRLQSEAAWPPAKIAIIKRNWGRRPASEIAELVGKSRNAVIGKAHRLGLPRLK